MLVKKQDFGAIQPKDAKLLCAYEDFMERFGGCITPEDMENWSDAYRDLMERFCPHHFTAEMVGQARTWIGTLFDKYELLYTEEHLTNLAKSLLYRQEAEGEGLTEEMVKALFRHTECRQSLDEPSIYQKEYYYLPEI